MAEDAGRLIVAEWRRESPLEARGILAAKARLNTPWTMSEAHTQQSTLTLARIRECCHRAVPSRLAQSSLATLDPQLSQPAVQGEAPVSRLPDVTARIGQAH